MRPATFQAKTSRSTRSFQGSSAVPHDGISLAPPGYGIELADGGHGEKVVPLPVAPIIQTKLTIGPPDDEYEQEADRVAESVMRMPSSASAGKPEEDEKKLGPGTVQTKPLAEQISPFVQRQAAAGGTENKEEEEEPVQLERLGPPRLRGRPSADFPGDFRLSAFSTESSTNGDAENPSTESWLQRMSAGPSSNERGMEGAARFAIRHKEPGEPMSSGIRSRLEAGIGFDLHHVRVHTGPVAHMAADHLQARAFTHRHDIWLGRGESPTDLRLMAHESTHVVQQDSAGHRLVFEGVQRRANGSTSAAGSGAPAASTGSSAASPAASAASPVTVEPLPAAGISAPPPRAEAPSPEATESVEVPAPDGAVPAEPGSEVELLMPEPPEGPSAADRRRMENVEQNASDAAAAQRDLPSAEENVTEAREAVAEPAEETAARAEGGLAAALSTRPEPSPAIEALCERILAVIHSRQPPDEESLLQSNPQEEAEAAGGVLESSVEGDVDRVEGSYDQLDHPPAGAPQQTAQSLEPPATSVGSPDIGAEQAVPDAVPAEDVSLDADVEASATRMDEAGMTSEPAQLVQSGPIAEARAAQGELAATAQRDPAEVLAEQQAARESAGADMAALQASALEALQASRAHTATDISSQQGGMVTSEEQLRTQLSTQARTIFTAAQERVDTLLEPLTRTAMQRWETGVQVLSTQFENDLARVQRWLDERYEGWTGAVLEFAEDIVGKPDWVTREYDRAEQNFADGVCDLIREISTEVNSVIATCEEIIDDANAQIAELFSADLPDSLREWAAAEQARFTEQLQGLRNRVISTRDEFNNDLAERAAQSVQEVRERIHELRQAARGLIGQIADAIDRFIEDPVRFIIDGLLELVGIPPPSFWALINRIQTVIADIADNPMNFANNLMAALAQGFQRFFDNFADHILSGFFDWLFSGLGAVGVEIPRDFSLKSIITFFLQLMGITWPRIRELLARHIGEENVALLERAYEIIANLIEMGPEGIFEMIKEQLNPQNILDQVLQAAIDYLVETLIVRVTARIMMMLNPAGAIAQAIEAIYRVLRWIFDNAARIFSLVETVVNGAAALIAGNIGGMAAAVEGALARLIAPVIDFLAGYLGLGNLPDRIADTIRGFQEWVMSILERVVAWLANRARALLRALGFGGEAEGGEREGDGQVGEPVPFSAGSDRHTLLFVIRNGDAQLVIRSREALVIDYLNSEGIRNAAANDDALHQKVEEAKRLAQNTDLEGDRILQLMRNDQFEQAEDLDDSVEGKEHRLAQLLSEILAQVGTEGNTIFDVLGSNINHLQDAPQGYRLFNRQVTVLSARYKEISRAAGRGQSAGANEYPHVHVEADRSIEAGKGPLQGDWALIEAYRVEVRRLSPEQKEGDEVPEVLAGNPESLVSGLIGRTQTRPEFATGVRSQMARMIEVIRSGGRVSGIEVSLGSRRHIDYTIRETQQGQDRLIGVEYKHWTGTLSRSRRNQLRVRLDNQLEAYVDGAANAGIHKLIVEWRGWDGLDSVSKGAFTLVINRAKRRAEEKGLEFERRYV